MNTAETEGQPGNPPGEQHQIGISTRDLPLHCPLSSMSLWNFHPRVYLPIEQTGHARCPYCGTEYVLKD
jgi:uncharacterized Zn-finger protein